MFLRKTGWIPNSNFPELNTSNNFKIKRKYSIFYAHKFKFKFENFEFNLHKRFGSLGGLDCRADSGRTSPSVRLRRSVELGFERPSV